MGSKRSKLTKASVAAGVGVGAAAWLRDPARRDRLRQVAIGLRDTVMPRGANGPELASGEAPPAPVDDEAHAPGHRHLHRPEREVPPGEAGAPAGRVQASHHTRGHGHRE